MASVSEPNGSLGAEPQWGLCPWSGQGTKPHLKLKAFRPIEIGEIKNALFSSRLKS